VRRVEQLFFAFCLAAWVVGLLAYFGIVDLAGRLSLGLYPLFTLAAALGWLCGNVWVHRSRGLPSGLTRRLWTFYFFGPPGLLYLLRQMAPEAELVAAPLVPVFAFSVYTVLFLVPVMLRRGDRPRRVRIGRSEAESDSSAGESRR
jgi:hypothetical protein